MWPHLGRQGEPLMTGWLGSSGWNRFLMSSGWEWQADWAEMVTADLQYLGVCVWGGFGWSTAEQELICGQVQFWLVLNLMDLNHMRASQWAAVGRAVNMWWWMRAGILMNTLRGLPTPYSQNQNLPQQGRCQTSHCWFINSDGAFCSFTVVWSNVQ